MHGQGRSVPVFTMCESLKQENQSSDKNRSAQSRDSFKLTEGLTVHSPKKLQKTHTHAEWQKSLYKVREAYIWKCLPMLSGRHQKAITLG